MQGYICAGLYLWRVVHKRITDAAEKISLRKIRLSPGHWHIERFLVLYNLNLEDMKVKGLGDLPNGEIKVNDDFIINMKYCGYIKES